MRVEYLNRPIWNAYADQVWTTWTSNTLTWSSNGTALPWTTSASTSVWGSWVTTTGTASSAIQYVAPAPVHLSVEEQQRLAEETARRAEETARRVEERAARTRAALERARETLRSILTDEQWEQYEREERFELITQSGRRYRIRLGVAGNVKLVEHGQEVESLCCHPSQTVRDEEGRYLGDLPTEDVVIAQVLALRADEEGFRRVANISDHRGRLVHASEGRQAAA